MRAAITPSCACGRSPLLVLACVAAPSGGAEPGHRLAVYDGYLVSQTRAHRRETWRWQRLMAKPRTPARRGELDPSHEYRRWVHRLWKRRSRCRPSARSPSSALSRVDVHPPLRGRLATDRRAVLRGAADEPGVPAHVRAGAARTQGDRQPLDADRADLGGRARVPPLGYQPWPNTARMCGLL